MRVLIGYASKHGSTREIAERVAQRLREHSHNAEARPFARARRADAYEVIVLGSAVYYSRWLKEATAYVRRNATALAARPAWLFSVGAARAVGARFNAPVNPPRDVTSIQRKIRPRGHRFFAGALRKEQLPLPGRLLSRLMRSGRADFRDWADIDAWADKIAAELAASGTSNGRSKAAKN
ncbi:flavodoxin domain-containing protein [Salinactinospora qingdaonensis]|uniref:Flavodoxin-like domain-containing protein n=1 Tax=Salinactinospora qingdaonensis TaxID=702744 RepID=A0ABP7GDK4_9ACTN